MNKEAYWFYLETYVLFFIKKNNVLLYNTLSGEIMYWRKALKIANFLRRLKTKSNMTINVSTDYLRMNAEISDFIKSAREKFMGDLISTDEVPSAPFNQAPIFNLMKSPLRLIKASNRSIGENALNYLREISIYINCNCSLDCKICNTAFKQFSFCKKSYPHAIISNNKLKKFLSQLNLKSLFKINVLGGDIFIHPELPEIARTLKSIPIKKVLYIHYINFCNRETALDFFKDESFIFNILVDSSSGFDGDAFDEVFSLVKKRKINVHFNFVVENDLLIEQSANIINDYKLSKSALIPFFTGSNLSFFEKHVFIKNKKMIEERKATMKDIFTKAVVNTTTFGKIFINNNGDIFSNFNFKRLGNISANTLHEVVYYEMLKGKAWRKLRKNVIPCKQCSFNLLCPPLSNYEFVIGKNHLCCIWNE